MVVNDDGKVAFLAQGLGGLFHGAPGPAKAVQQDDGFFLVHLSHNGVPA